MTGDGSNRLYPDRPIVAVGALVWKGENLLMIRRGKPPRAGEWSLPGGRQELGESLEETFHREVYEETGVMADILCLAAAVDSIHRDTRGQVSYHYTLIDYTALWHSGEPRPGPDELDAAWMSPAERARLDLWPVTRDVIAQSWRQIEANTD
ncbi:MAG: NUDIX hydrolase [Alphaproteobacteria bacterium]